MNPVRDAVVTVAAVAVVIVALLWINEHTWHVDLGGVHIFGTK